MRFEPGRLIVRRQFHRGDRLGRVWTGRVAADDERGLALWIADGSAFGDVGAADGRLFREVPFGEWGRTTPKMRHINWSTSVLMLHPADGDYSTWLFFDGAGRFRSWYVNLERPVVRWPGGIDTVDYDLDIVVAPDRTWRWKDEEEFAAHLAHPEVYWCEDESAVWAEGHRVVKLIEAGAYPFDSTWTTYAPDPAWPVPGELPREWDAPRAW